ncbi:hypothetical protein N9B82_01860 [Saprospiraceae bacterium]|nr:hypothetical protein [Saprospiraceae bacterium]
MKFALLSFLSMFILTNACFDYPAQEFERQGISFTCPSGWKLTDLMEFGPMGGQVTAEKAGYGASGLVIISWFNFDIDPDSSIEGLEEGLSTGLLRLRKCKFSEIEDYQLGGFPARRKTYNGQLLGQKIVGELIGFSEKERTITIAIQENVEDIDENRLGFQELMASILVGENPVEKDKI